MLVNFSEYCISLEDQSNDVIGVWKQLRFTPPYVSMNFFKPYLAQKKSLIEVKDTALDNVSKKFVEISSSNANLLQKAVDVQSKAFSSRQNLELTLLMSESVKLDIEIAKLKVMSAETFTATYGL